MNYYKASKKIILGIDIFTITISFVLVYLLRFRNLLESSRSTELTSMYVVFFIVTSALYAVIFMSRGKPVLERQSYKEIWFDVTRQQFFLMSFYVLLFFMLRMTFIIDRVVVSLFFGGSVILDGVGRYLYHKYCVWRTYRSRIPLADKDRNSRNIRQLIDVTDNTVDVRKLENTDVQHVYIIGSKSIGQYGGFESFVMNLLKGQENNKNIKYHVTCKKNGNGYMDVSRLRGASMINEDEFIYYNAHCCLIDINEKLGSGQALDYDIKAFKWVCDHIEKNHVLHPIVYILASRIGLFEGKYVRKVHKADGKIFQNPDGHENWRSRWKLMIRWYWKLSEKMMVKNADLVICDSKNIESYIRDEYASYHPDTVWIPYGSIVIKSTLSDNDPKYLNWLANHNLRDGHFYISVGRFVPENNFEIMIREFMSSNTDKDFAIITTEYPKLMSELQQKLHFERDRRIKFVGAVYDQELLTKIRVNAYGYLHGHSVGGTNPSLLEALGTTKLNLLLDVGFNREVAEDGALYWNESKGSLASLINQTDKMKPEEIRDTGEKAKQRIRDEYRWEDICEKYEKIFALQN